MLKLHTYQLGTPRRRGEGLRVGVVRHLPRGVRKEGYARLGHFDVWFPNVAPSAELLRWVHESPETRWTRFVERYVREMKQPDSATPLNCWPRWRSARRSASAASVPTKAIVTARFCAN